MYDTSDKDLGKTDAYIREISVTLTASVWCQPDTSMIEMDTRLANHFAHLLEGWIRQCVREQSATKFYQGLLDDCAQHLGPEVFVSDDGSVQGSPIRLKIPEMVEDLVKTVKKFQKKLKN